MGKKGSPKTLWDYLGRVRDDRSEQGRRYELQSLLGLAVAAALGGCSSLYAIAQWVEQVSKKGLLHLFGIERRGTPCHATFHYVFTGLNVRSLERALVRWVKSVLGEEELGHVAIDGKEIRGSKHGEYPGLRLIAAYCEKLKGVVAELKLPEGTNEIGAAYKLLREMPLDGTIVTGDAIYTQKRLCRKIVEVGADKKEDRSEPHHCSPPACPSQATMHVSAPIRPSSRGTRSALRRNGSRPGLSPAALCYTNRAPDV